MDTNSVAVRAACVDMLKGGQRQMRHRLKKYFDGVLANLVRTTSPVTCMTDDQWRALVEMWSNPKHKDTYVKNQVNHAKVHFHQRIGSRCYIAHAYVTVAMEAIEAKPMQEGQKSMSSIEIVSKVLPKSSTFLQNVGLPICKPSSRSAVSSQVWELQAQLEAKEQESAQLKQESAQLKQGVASQAHEIDSLKKEQQEAHALLRQLILHFNQGQVTPPYNL
ncbi:uncharacterized protein [Miscanthus floridulus]|uniref:uncharacterized protein n=1 Tax=Miscanthus floridulus TaxID=154761 RepID=UPI0034578ED4